MLKMDDANSLIPVAQKIFLDALPEWSARRPPYKLDLDLIKILDQERKWVKTHVMWKHPVDVFCSYLANLYEFLVSNDLQDAQSLFQNAITQEIEKQKEVHGSEGFHVVEEVNQKLMKNTISCAL